MVYDVDITHRTKESYSFLVVTLVYYAIQIEVVLMRKVIMQSKGGRLGVVLWCLVLLCCTSNATVFAHGGEPLPREVIDVGQGQWLLKTNFGLIRSQDPTRFICEESFLGGDDFLISAIGPDQWVIATDSNMVRTDDGCTFKVGMVLDEVPKSLIVSPNRQTVVFVTNDETLLAPFWYSEDAGKSYQSLSVGIDDVFWTGARFASTKDVVLSGYSSADQDKGAAIFARVDIQAKTVTQLDVSAMLRYPYIFAGAGGFVAGIASDVASGDLVLFYDQPNKLGTVVESLDVWPTDIGLSADGLKIWVGQSVSATGARYGQRQADDVQWSVIMDGYQLLCVHAIDDVIFACTDRDEWAGDLVTLADNQPMTKVSFKQLVGARHDCPAQSEVRKTCPLVWTEVAKQLRIPIVDMGQEIDMGSSDMDDPMDQSPDMSAPPSQTDQCAIGGHLPEGDVRWTYLMWLGVLCLIRRR